PTPLPYTTLFRSPFSRHISAIFSTGNNTPVSLFAHIIETSVVSGRIAASNSPRSTLPCRSTPRNVTSHARFVRSWHGRRTALCSTALVTTCLPRGSNLSAELITALFDSVPPLVKTISDGSHPSNLASRPRRKSTEFL